MSKGLGRIQRGCLRILGQYEAAGKRPTMLNIASEVYRVKPNRLSDEQHAATRRASSSDIAAQSPSEERIAILLVQPDIESAADLTNKVIAIDGLQSSSIADIRNAIISTGAADVQLSASESLALLRMVNGEVPASVVDLVTPTAAEKWSGDTRGFNILRIPLPTASERSDRG